MIGSDKIHKIPYGGDYNPEQWPEEVWEEDMRLFHLAGVDTVTLNVFSWASLQPDENVYDFERLDKIMELMRKNHLQVCLGTSTAAHPAWMARRYPDILRTDETGMKRRFGARHNSCPHSPAYRKYSVMLCKAIANRYKDYDNIVAWHVSNEYGGACYCENCAAAFRVWLRKKYGTIEALNDAWNTSFWGHTFYDFEEIVPADLRSEEFRYDFDGRIRTNFQGISLDYMRFTSDSMLECFVLERDALKEITPRIPVTTNFMGWFKGLDYFKWAKEMDFVSWDNYPEWDSLPSHPAGFHDVVRGMKDGMPFSLMEQSPSVSNWHPYCRLKRPGVMRLLSYQAIAHGADTVMFFQMRRSVGACEKYHGALIDHVGTEHTRVFKEMQELGAELQKIGDATLGTRTHAKVAIVFDWENWWAAEMSAGPTVLINYYEEVMSYYTALFNQNIPVDFIRTDSDLTTYDLVIAPLLYMNRNGYDEKVRNYVRNGGCYLTTYFSGYVDENDKVLPGGYPGKQKDILGIWVEESDAVPPGMENSFIYKGTKYPAGVLCDLLHLEGAQEISTYESDFYAGWPVLTKNKFGDGTVYYVGTRSSAEFYATFLRDLCESLFIEPVLNAPLDVEVRCREDHEYRYLFILNHKDSETEVRLKKEGMDILTDLQYKAGDPVKLPAKGVSIIRVRYGT
ncbi:MAG: beta-galactosidase [Lachnospiraceae bacterium]|nr:beta-galactosidase [Lachnospiraceae bacterium]